MQLKLKSLTLLAVLALGACSQPALKTPETLAAQYQAAVADAAIAKPDEVSLNLVAIHEQNQQLTWKSIEGANYVKVVTWTNYDGYKKAVGQSMDMGVDAWVTAVPTLQNFCAEQADELRADSAAMALRLEQLLGLKPHSGKNQFVELWAQPSDLFRPCADPEISDWGCDVDFPQQAISQPAPAHRAWIEQLMASSYGPEGYPWTRLGYTYDWGSADSHVGLSEFVVRKGAKVYVEGVTENAQYCH